jgi:hypothetical protein
MMMMMMIMIIIIIIMIIIIIIIIIINYYFEHCPSSDFLKNSVSKIGSYFHFQANRT